MEEFHNVEILRKLTRCETIETYKEWRIGLLCHLHNEEAFHPFLSTNFKWKKHSRSNPLRGLGEIYDHTTAEQMTALLEIFLLQIAEYCPIISCLSIVRSTTCLKDIWQRIEQHFNFIIPPDDDLRRDPIPADTHEYDNKSDPSFDKMENECIHTGENDGKSGNIKGVHKTFSNSTISEITWIFTL